MWIWIVTVLFLVAVIGWICIRAKRREDVLRAVITKRDQEIVNMQQSCKETIIDVQARRDERIAKVEEEKERLRGEINNLYCETDHFVAAITAMAVKLGRDASIAYRYPSDHSPMVVLDLIQSRISFFIDRGSLPLFAFLPDHQGDVPPCLLPVSRPDALKDLAQYVNSLWEERDFKPGDMITCKWSDKPGKYVDITRDGGTVLVNVKGVPCSWPGRFCEKVTE